MDRIDYVRTESQELDRFSRLLDAYAAELKRLEANIKNANAEIRYGWKDRQYDRVRDVIESSMRRLEKQLSELNFLNTLVKKKRQILLRAE